MDFLSGMSPLIGGGLSYLGQRSANKANLQIAREQMGWQTQMSNTSYQRAMLDMEQAGLNPILAYRQGGASTPPGSSAQMQNELSGAVSSAADAARLRLDTKRMNAELQNLSETNSKLKADTDLSKAMKRVAEEEAYLKNSSAKTIEADLPIHRNDASYDQSIMGKFSRLIQTLSPLTGFNPVRYHKKL